MQDETKKSFSDNFVMADGQCYNAIDMESEVAFDRIVQLLGCKWSIRILKSLESGPIRPSQVLRDIEGLPARVMHRCLERMERDGLISKTIFPITPPHTEYQLTHHGTEFVGLLESAEGLASRWTGTQPPVKL